MADRSDKTEKPTPKRLKQAKKDGQIARSPDVGVWLGMLVAVYLLRLTVSNTVHLSQTLFAQTGDVIQNPDAAKTVHLLSAALLKGAVAVAPLALGMLVTGVVASAAQGGVHVSAKGFKPKWDHLNPFKGLKRVFGVRGAWEVGKALVKTAILGFLLYQAIRSVVPLTQTGNVVPLGTVLHKTGDALFSFARNAAIAGLLMAAADYAYQFKRTRSALKMSKQEVKDEYRNAEGDPHIKSAIKSRQMAMRRSRMMAAIAGADVVLVNPTHVAVALKYQAGKGAPKVVAKGAGAIAARIRAEAEKHRVPMVEDVPLARAIYRVCELGQEIPHELFVAVARILAFVFSLRRRGSAAGLHRPGATPQSVVEGVKKRRGRRGVRPAKPAPSGGRTPAR
jgi:flagellar biosynthetic protein FlhB